MKRLTAPWTSALATAALLALPAAGRAQTPQTPPEPQPQQSTTLSTPTAQNNSAAEHLRLAKEALAAVEVDSVPARAKSQMTALRRHINSLERSVGANETPSATGSSRRSAGKRTSRASASWANDVAAIDRIITQLAGDVPTSGATEPGAVGTTGSKSKASTAVTLDENTRNQLLEVRKHVTEFAAAMRGTSTSQKPPTGAPGSSATSQQQPTPSAAAETAAATGQTQSSAASGQASTTGTTGQAPTTTSPTTGQTSSTPGQPGTTTPGQTETTPADQPNVDPEGAKQHLTAARNSLTQLTQLPAAAQLQGAARAQVSQLIQNFNELIMTQADWRAAYDKVEANLTMLIGPAPQKSASTTTPSTEPSATAAPPPTPTPEPSPTNPPTSPTTPTEPQTGTQGTQGTQQPGAVGTSGSTTITLDPAIRQKLAEFREHLVKFHDAAGGGSK